MLASTLDTEIVLQKDGVGLRPLPIKFIVLTIASGIACLKCVTTPLISVGSIFQKIVFAALWMTITVLLFMNDKTKRLNVSRLISAINYFANPSNRQVDTRRTDPANGMMDICGILRIDDGSEGKDTRGLITFADKTYGYMYRVTGSASALLFDSDQATIVNAVDNFYRKPDDDTEFIFITTKEAQRTYRQVAAVKQRYKKLQFHDPDLTALLDKQVKILRERVGKEYLSIHQYMIIKSKSMEALRKAQVVVQNELDSGALYIRRCICLDEVDVCEILSSIYTVPKWDVEDEG